VTTNDELKPCPFCGGRARILDYDDGNGGYYSICECEKCGAKGSESNCGRNYTVKRWNERTEIDRIIKERDEAIWRKEFTEQWYAERLEPIKDVAKRVGLWSEISAIIANGSGTRRREDGTFIYEPPTYAQQLNGAKNKLSSLNRVFASALNIMLPFVELYKDIKQKADDIGFQQLNDDSTIGLIYPSGDSSDKLTIGHLRAVVSFIEQHEET
jgi:Lar family restriction alleviation protein